LIEKLNADKVQAKNAVLKKNKDLTDKVIDELHYEDDDNKHPLIADLPFELKLTPYVWGNNNRN
jgi:hypothetical protein